MGLLAFRGLIVVVIAVGGYFYPPFGLTRATGTAAALVLTLLFMFLETRIRKVQFNILWSATIGTFLGIVLGWMFGSIYQTIVRGEAMTSFVRIFFLAIMPYIGFAVGTRRAEWLAPSHLSRFFREKSVDRSFKILDTSVIIDGRIADICDTAFVEGSLVVPQFILKELQAIADSPDALKRQRGRRGLEVLGRLQKSSQISVIISDLDFPEVREVDSKVVECAKNLGATIITNDFNLNKVAKLQGLTVLNINELANALKPVVLPGETMNVFILKEGKERDQGVAYLDDGTMVVVDNSRRMIGQTVGITVTSVLQTTVGKMIFGRFTNNEESK
jgi:uncharacterized protein YacL